jgi:hypothetical protein
MASLFGQRTRRDWHFALLAVFGLGVPRVLVQSSATAAFVGIYGAASLAVIYLAVAAAIPLCMALFLRAERRVSRNALLLGTQCVRIAALLILWLGSGSAQSEWIAIAAVIWLEIEFVLGSLVFWGLAGQSYDLTDAKKSYAFIAGGEQVGAILAGFAVGPLLFLLAPSQLFLAAGLGLAASLAIMVPILRGLPALDVTARETRRRADEKPPPFNSSVRFYLGLMLAAAFLANLGYCLVDNVFYRSLEQAYPDEEAMAAFIGITFGLAGAATLAYSLFIGGHMTLRFGVAVLVSWLPGMLTAITALLVLGSGLGLLPPLAVFWLIVALKISDDGLRVAIYRPVFQTLYQPLPAARRIRAMARSEGLAEPLGLAAGGLILLAAAELGWQLLPLLALGLASFAAWLLTTVSIRQTYVTIIDLALKGRQNVSFGPEALMGHETRTLLLRKLVTGTTQEVTRAMELLGLAHRQLFLQAAPTLVLTGEPALAGSILARLQPEELAPLAPILKNRYLHERSDWFQRMLLAALGASRHPAAASVLLAQIRSGGPLRDIALPALLHNGQAGAAEIAIRHMRMLAASDRPADQRLFLSAFALSGSARFHAHVVALFRHPDAALARRAIRAAGQSGRAALFVAPLLTALRNPALADAAGRAIVMLGEAAAPALGAVLARNEQVELRALAARLLGQIARPSAVLALRGQINTTEAWLSCALARALFTAAVPLDRRERARAVVQARTLFRHAKDGLDTLGALSGLTGAEPLCRAIERQTETLVVGGFLWLALRKGEFAIDLERLLPQRSPRANRAYLEELTQALATPSLRGLAASLINNKVATKARGAQPVEIKALLHKLIAGAPRQQPWVRACALSLAMRLMPDDRRPAETVAQEAGLAGDVARDLIAAATQAGKGDAMALTITEKVLLLKSFDLFRSVPDDVLAAFAPVLTAVSYTAGDTLAEEGTPGDSLFVLADGTINVRKGGMVQQNIDAPAIIDELVALYPQTRPHTLVAASDCQIITIANDDMEALIGADASTGFGVIRLLSERLSKATGQA